MACDLASLPEEAIIRACIARETVARGGAWKGWTETPPPERAAYVESARRTGIRAMRAAIAAAFAVTDHS